MNNEAVLCYVEDHIAFFTTQPLDKQWGDDWNDIPYEHNAGRPYDPCWHNHPRHRKEQLCRCKPCIRDWNDDGTPKWKIIKIGFEGNFDNPYSGYLNSPWSVERINNRKIPWLQTGSPHNIAIFAGATIIEFCEEIQKAGGKVSIAPEDITKWLQWLKSVICF